jgi:trehalose 6-phosphate synthase
MKLLDGRLINVSNRLPVEIKSRGGVARLNSSAGGLASALDSIWQQQHGLWIGWAGPVPLEEAAPLLQRAVKGRPYSYRAVPLSQQEVSKFYSGFANEIIWPLFHDMPSRCNFDPEYWEVYQRVNRKFAQTTAENASSKDLIWAHDYHLMLMGHYLRETGCTARTGFFLHIPFPAPDVFEKLPWRKSILRGLLEYHLIGFQTDRDRANFLNCVERVLPEAMAQREDSHHTVTLDHRRANVATFPISIAFEEFSNHAASRDVEEAATQLRRELNNNFIVLGVDRMDYTKGIPERLKAFRILLRRFPELRHRVTLLQVVVPSREDIREYKQLRREVELLVSQINGEFTEAGWVPIHYIHRNLARKHLLSYYRAADIALITSLKDGMNLVAKEFCAAQIDEQGVVVISEFAGAAAELRHGALVVNPNDLAGMAEAIHRACVMPVEEKRARMQLMREIVHKYNVHRWAESFLAALLATKEGNTASSGRSGSEGDFPLVASSAAPDQRIA